MSELQRKCSKCLNATANDNNKNLRFHRFPLPGKHGSLKARVWAEFCYPGGNWSTEESLRRLHQQLIVLCSKHFDDSSYTSTARKRLNNFAIPIGTESIMLKLRQEQSSTLTDNTNPIIPDVKLQEDQEQSSTSTDTTNPIIPEVKLQEDQELSSTSTDPKNQTIQDVQLQVPKTTKGCLRELGLSRSSELTPRKRKLYVKCRRNLSEIIRLRKKMKKQRRLVLNRLIADQNVKYLMDQNLSGSFALLLQSQLKNTPRKLTGHRWSIEDKVMALGPNCKQCQTAMLVDQNTELSHLFTSFKEYESMRSSLIYGNKHFTETVEIAATIVNKYLNEHSCDVFIKKTIIEKLKYQIDFEWLLECSDHYEQNVMFLISSTIAICVKRFCVLKNRNFLEEAARKASKRKINILHNI